MHYRTDDLRIEKLKPLISPAIIMEELPVNDLASKTVSDGRQGVSSCLQGKDDRLVAVVGPCSIHDVDAALEYAKKLKVVADRLQGELQMVMRVYFEKPRTTVGWKGMINDPDLDNSFNINKGLRKARALLVKLAEMGLPVGCEYLDTIMPQFFADLVSWGAIGARTTESQVHRELASGLSMPIGFKNGTDGNIQIAIDACRAASEAHHFLSVTKQSVAAIVATKGNKDSHLILRGCSSGPNYEEKFVTQISSILKESGQHHRLMIDCSHGNSQKDASLQPQVAENIAKQYATGSDNIFGFMLESHLVSGNQKVVAGQPLVYGQSITDACIGWDDTEKTLEVMARAVREHRKNRSK